MATILLPPDFKDFLHLLNSEKIEYLLIGGYAVSYYGYPRATGDMDVWVASHPDNADRLVAAIRQFGFSDPSLSASLFLQKKQVIRMGVPPLRIEVLTGISGVEFADCYARRKIEIVDGIEVSFISVADLKANKRAAGRAKDIADLQNLP